MESEVYNSAVQWWTYAVAPTILAGIGVVFWLGTWKGKIDEHKSNVTIFMDEIKKDLKEIRDHLFKGKFSAAQSPYRLTPLGEKVSAGINAKEWAKELAPKLLVRVKGLTKEYEVYEFCEQYVENEFTPEEDLKKLIREVTYEHGSNSLGVRVIFTIELRDALLEHLKLETERL